MHVWRILLVIVAVVHSLHADVWKQTDAPVENWQAVASSADGIKLVAVIAGDGIWTSTNSGSNWIKSGAPADNWISVASSADGAKLIAATADLDYEDGSDTGSVY